MNNFRLEGKPEKACICCKSGDIKTNKNIFLFDIEDFWDVCPLCVKCREKITIDIFHRNVNDDANIFKLWICNNIKQKYGDSYRKIDYRLSEQIALMIQTTQDYD